MKLNEAHEVFSVLNAVFRHAFAELIASNAVGVAQVVNACEQCSELFTVGNHATDRGATEVHTVVATFAANQAGATAFAIGFVIASAILSAVSTLSEPELVKNTC